MGVEHPLPVVHSNFMIIHHPAELIKLNVYVHSDVAREGFGCYNILPIVFFFVIDKIKVKKVVDLNLRVYLTKVYGGGWEGA